MVPLDDRNAKLRRRPLLAAAGFGLGSAALATFAFSFPPGGPPLGAIVAFAVSLGVAVAIIAYVGLSALS